MTYIVIARKGTEQVRFQRDDVQEAFRTARKLRSLGWMVRVSKPLRGVARAA